jgi:hypothetical protein
MYIYSLLLLNMSNYKEPEIVFSSPKYTKPDSYLIALRGSFWRSFAASLLTLKKYDEREIDLLGTTTINTFNNSITLGDYITDLAARSNINVYNKQLIATFASITGAFDDFAITSTRNKIIVTVEVGSCAIYRLLRNIERKPLRECSTLCVYPSMIRTLLNTYNDIGFNNAIIDGNKVIIKEGYCTFCYNL